MRKPSFFLKKEGFRLGEKQLSYAKGVIARKAGLEVCGVILALVAMTVSFCPSPYLNVITSFPVSGVLISRLLILKDLPLVIPQDHLSFVLGN